MNNQELQQIIETRIAELNSTAMHKDQELRIPLQQKMLESEEFLLLLKNEQQSLEHRLAQTKAYIDEPTPHLDFSLIIDEMEQALSDENVDIEQLSPKVQHQLQEAANQQINEMKMKALNLQQEISEGLQESKLRLTNKPSLFATLNKQIQHHFGDKIPWIRIKLAEQLESCAGKLKA